MAKKKGNPTRRLLFIIGGLLLVLILFLAVGRAVGWFGGGDDGIEVETAQAEIRTITQVVTASGQVQPEVEVKISPDVSGEIIFMDIKEGDQVKNGQLLVRIKPDFYAAQLEQATAGVSQAQANMTRAKADMLQAELALNRQKALYENNAVSESDFQTAQTQYDVAKANHEAMKFQVESARARAREAREQVAKTTIYAPMSGTVSQLNVEVGERVVGTTQMTGTEILRIALLNQMELEAEVNENDVVNITLGDTAAIEIDAYPDQAFRGVVTEIANSARVTGMGTQDQVTNFPVKIRVLDPHNIMAGGSDRVVKATEVNVAESAPQFRPGMSGTVDVFTQSVNEAVAVPIQAVTVRDFNKVKPGGEDEGSEGDEANEETPAETAAMPEQEDLRRVVFVMVDGQAEMIEVETGISDDSHVHVTSGLSGEETVIIGPYRAVSRQLRPEAKVKERNAPVPRGD